MGYSNYPSLGHESFLDEFDTLSVNPEVRVSSAARRLKLGAIVIQGNLQVIYKWLTSIEEFRKVALCNAKTFVILNTFAI